MSAAGPMPSETAKARLPALKGPVGAVVGGLAAAGEAQGKRGGRVALGRGARSGDLVELGGDGLDGRKPAGGALDVGDGEDLLGVGELVEGRHFERRRGGVEGG